MLVESFCFWVGGGSCRAFGRLIFGAVFGT